MKTLTNYQRRKLREKIGHLAYVIDDAQNEAEEIQRLLDADLKKRKRIRLTATK